MKLSSNILQLNDISNVLKPLRFSQRANLVTLMDLSWVFAVLISSVNDPLNSFSSPSSGNCSLNNPKSHKKVILKCLEGFTWCYVRGRSIINCKHPVKIRSTIKESNNRLALPVWSDAYKDGKNVSLLGIHEFSVYLKFFSS